MSLLELERTARQTGDQKTLNSLIPEIINSTPYDQKAFILKSLILKKNQSHSAIKKAFKILIDQNFHEINQKSLNFLIEISKICEGHVFLEHERIFLVTVLKNYYENEYLKTGDVQYIENAMEVIVDVYVETFSTVGDEIVMDFMMEQLRLCLILGNKIFAENVVRKLRTSKILNSNSHSEISNTNSDYNFDVSTHFLKIKYYAIISDFHIFTQNFGKASENLLKLNDCLKKFENVNYDVISKKILSQSTSVEILDISKLDLSINFSKIFSKETFFLHQKIDVLCQNSKLILFYASICGIIGFVELDSLISNIDNTEITRNILRNFQNDELITNYKDNNDMTSLSYLLNLNDEFYNYSGSKLILEMLRSTLLRHNLRILNKFSSEIKLETMSKILNEDIDYISKSLCENVQKEAFEFKIDQIEGLIVFGRKSKGFGIGVSEVMNKLVYASELIDELSL